MFEKNSFSSLKKIKKLYKVLAISFYLLLMSYIQVFGMDEKAKNAELFSLPIFRAMILILYVLILSLVSIFLFRYLYSYFFEKSKKTNLKRR